MNEVENPTATPLVVVDDESLIRTLVCRIFSSRRIVAFGSAEEFEQGFDASEPHIIVVDKNMPGQSGLELLEHHARRSPSEFEAVLITGFADNDSAVLAMRLGVSSYVRKPFRVEEIVHAVNAAEQRLLLRLRLRETEQRLRRTEAQLQEARESHRMAALQGPAKDALVELRQAAASAAVAAEGSFVARRERLLGDLLDTLQGSLDTVDSAAPSEEKSTNAGLPGESTPAGSELPPRGITAQLERVRRLAGDLESLAHQVDRDAMFDLREVISIGERLLRPLVSKIGELQVAVPDDPMCVEGDRARLAQVVANVLINAAEAIDGTSGGQVALVLEEQAGCALITVIDNGEGIPPDQLAHVFDPYGGKDQAGQRLGLAEAYDIITQHGGTIAVESDAGAGTRVTVKLPLAQPTGTMFYQGVPPHDGAQQ